MDLSSKSVLVVGAGIMGAGIAQVAAQAMRAEGQQVFLHDTREGAAAEAKAKLASTLQGLVGKGKLTVEACEGALARIVPISSLQAVAASAGQGSSSDAGASAGLGLVVEAIVEKLDVKRSLFRELEGLVGDDCVLATNTSSISVTAIANGLKRPERLVGMHFFNPVPLMKLVEVVSGLHTDAAVAKAIFDLSQVWGKVPVHAKSTPGFIVNRIARPYYAETLALLQEQAAAPEVLDACLRTVGFRMGPCELMDLIGHDTNFAVTNSVYEANFYDKRYMPSLVQRELVDGGMLGRKSGRGFYRYPQGVPALPAVTVQSMAASAAARAAEDDRHGGVVVQGVHIVPTDGRTARELARDLGTGAVVVHDRMMGAAAAAAGRAAGTGVATEARAPALACAAAPGLSAEQRAVAVAHLLSLGVEPHEVGDTPGLVVARTVAMLINEASDAVHQGVCTPDGADAAMKLGVNYPAGPFEWLQAWSVEGVVALLDRLDAHYRGERYRVSPRLRG
jgi:3-hydroxybutyryl-CoA dehydrogenase